VDARHKAGHDGKASWCFGIVVIAGRGVFAPEDPAIHEAWQSKK
jgi:hypothetical protein